MFDFLFRYNIGPKSIFFFMIFCGLLFLSMNWKVTYQVSKDVVTAAQESDHGESIQKAQSRTFDETHRRLDN